ncbi:MAG: AMP-binding protein [Deltaproteobacteria bacterium]|jgi:long-chain acyl-CoA synthetase|nr:AMP-binding protein [Deltaproteobacteria bacterium]MBW2537261.1 AMP-binding protein [Deltaproteobacteria bacterium]
MDVTPFLELRPAPHAIFESLEARRDQARYYLPEPDGSWRAVTWGAVAREVRSVASYLLEIGLAPTERAAIFAPNRVEWMSAAMGIQAARGAMVPIYPASTAEQAAYIVEHSGARALFVDTAPLLDRLLATPRALADVERIVLLDDGIDREAALERARERTPSSGATEPLAAKLISWSEAQRIGAERAAAHPDEVERVLGAIDLDQPGMMLYTSGTTGNPKGVPLTHRNVGVNGRDWLTCNGPLLDDHPVDVLWLPMSHIFGFGEACLGNTLGFTTYLSEPLTVLERLPELRPSVFMSVPAYWEKLAQGVADLPTVDERRDELARITGGRLQFCLSGGAGLKREVKELLYECGLLIIEGYGLTECSPTLTLNRHDAFRFDTVGKPLPSVELELAPDGEILARGQSVFAGYHRDEEATRAAFTEDGWFRTGDVGRMTEDGFLQIVDRKKEILVTAGGKNVPPANVEVRFADDPLFDHLVVYGDGKKYLVAGVWLNEAVARAELGAGDSSEPLGSAAMRALIEERIGRINEGLARHERIRRFGIMPRPLTVEGGLLTSTLKLRRKHVYEAFHAELEAIYDD